MRRALWLAMLCVICSRPASAQAPGVLHIKVVVVDAEGKLIPVPKHVLLVSDNPSTAAPRQVTTALDGTADVRLRPGNYTVESDQPIVFHGKAYQWTQTVDIVAGRDAVLELTADNAEPMAANAAPDSAIPLETDPLFVLPKWQDSVVALWMPATHASGFVIDASGLVVTNQRVVGTATSAEVQVSPTVKVDARVVATDSVRDVAVLRIAASVAASVLAVPLGCAQGARPTIVDGQKVFAIGAPLHAQKGVTSGTITRIGPHSFAADLILQPGSAGGPVFTASGELIGITSLADETGDSRYVGSRVVRIEDACSAVASAQKRLKDTPAPDATPLPVEPTRLFATAALEEAVQGRAGSLNPYSMSSSEFDVAFITPVLLYGAQYYAERAHTSVVRPGMDFRNWSEYVANLPPVLLVRVTPKAEEGFWTTVARGAARTQGVNVPPIKRVKSAFSRMRVFCGDSEVTPIHRLSIEQRLTEERAVYEGLYVLDPAALGPHCGAVKLVLYSAKEPEKGETRLVDPDVVQQFWRDFARYREP